MRPSHTAMPVLGLLLSAMKTMAKVLHASMPQWNLVLWGARAVLVKSFARIHETNLKKQGMLALTFANKDDYDKIREDDRIDIVGLKHFGVGKPLQIRLNHADGSTEVLK